MKQLTELGMMVPNVVTLQLRLVCAVDVLPFDKYPW
jgi:hypothetical protein